MRSVLFMIIDDLKVEVYFVLFIFKVFKEFGYVVDCDKLVEMIFDINF